MKTYEILKTFNGSQDGLHTEVFTEGTTRHLSDDLAAIAMSEGWVKPASAAEARETKVDAPEEVKEEAKPAKKGRK